MASKVGREHAESLDEELSDLPAPVVGVTSPPVEKYDRYTPNTVVSEEKGDVG
jgi:hypothetical protein